jgi:RNA-directed DNA polymerase
MLQLKLQHLFTEAINWLYKNRSAHPPASNIWNFRRSRDERSDMIIKDFSNGTCLFNVQKKITLSCGETIAIWSSENALIIKVLTGVPQESLNPFLLKTCYPLKGSGGLKGAVRDIAGLLPKYKFFCKTDVKSYYDSIDHFNL